jgi:hypothetical protein
MRAAVMQDDLFSHEALLPLAMIREHTKTDDVPSVTDPMLALYRSAALEAAEAYTGMILSGRKAITEVVRIPPMQPGSYRRQFTHRTRYALADGRAWFYGFEGGAVHEVQADPGTNEVRLPMVMTDFGMGCCNPCADGGSRLMYYAGLSCAERVPGAFKLGALKYIAHVIENPGDLVSSYGTGGDKVQGGYEAANPALASGAIDIWRTMRPEAI